MEHSELFGKESCNKTHKKILREELYFLGRESSDKVCRSRVCPTATD